MHAVCCSGIFMRFYRVRELKIHPSWWQTGKYFLLRGFTSASLNIHIQIFSSCIQTSISIISMQTTVKKRENLKNLFTRSGCNKAFEVSFPHCRCPCCRLQLHCTQSTCLHIYLHCSKSNISRRKITISDIFKNNFLLRHFFTSSPLAKHCHVYFFYKEIPPPSCVFRVCYEQKLHSTTVCEAWIFNASLSSILFTLAFLIACIAFFPCIKPPTSRKKDFSIYLILFSTSSSNDFKICWFKRYNDDFSPFMPHIRSHIGNIENFSGIKKHFMCVQWRRMKIESCFSNSRFHAYDDGFCAILSEKVESITNTCLR